MMHLEVTFVEGQTQYPLNKIYHNPINIAKRISSRLKPAFPCDNAVR